MSWWFRRTSFACLTSAVVKSSRKEILISDATQMGVERNVLTFKARVITFRLQVLYTSSVVEVSDRHTV